VATAVQLRFNVLRSNALPERVRLRLLVTQANRISADGWLQVAAQQHRSQARNREDARERLAALIRNATIDPKPRKKTRPTAAARRRRLEGKRDLSRRKRLRSKPSMDD
jgi:ribosome-associated protein